MKNYEQDKVKWEVYSDVDISPFFGAIADENQFDQSKKNPVPMGGEGHVEVEDQSGRFILIYNENVDAMKKDVFYDDIFRE